jgi:8-oxo-dGTP diphosphatase
MRLPDVSSGSPGNGDDPITEETFLESYEPSEFDRPSVAVDVVLLTIRQGRLSVLLIERGLHPFKDAWALPGGFLRVTETTEEAARRELQEETRIGVVQHLEQLRTFDAIDRDPRMRVLSVAYLGMMPDLPLPTAGSDAANARWWAVEDLDLTQEEDRLAFDHAAIIAEGVERARAKLEYTTLATSFVTSPFTIADLRLVYEAVWSTHLHPQNFRRKVLSTSDFVAPAGAKVRTTGPPADLYVPGDASWLDPPIRRTSDRDTREVGRQTA